AYHIEVYEEQVIKAQNNEAEKISEHKVVEKNLIAVQQALENATALYESEQKNLQSVEQWKKEQSRMEEHVTIVKELDYKKKNINKKLNKEKKNNQGEKNMSEA